MIEQWILEDERELEARCARYRSAQSALRRDEQEEDFDGLRPDEPGTAA